MYINISAAHICDKAQEDQSGQVDSQRMFRLEGFSLGKLDEGGIPHKTYWCVTVCLICSTFEDDLIWYITILCIQVVFFMN